MSEDAAAPIQVFPEPKKPISDVERREQHIKEHGGRVPTEEDFADVLKPEGNMSGDIVGTDVADSPWASNDSLGGTG